MKRNHAELVADMVDAIRLSEEPAGTALQYATHFYTPHSRLRLLLEDLEDFAAGNTELDKKTAGERLEGLAAVLFAGLHGQPDGEVAQLARHRLGHWVLFTDSFSLTLGAAGLDTTNPLEAARAAVAALEAPHGT